MRSVWRGLLAALLALLLLWLALPRLLGLAAERWLDVPGLEAVAVDIESIGAGRAHLREVRAVYRSNGGLLIRFALHDIVADYSLARRHVKRLDIARAELEIVPPESSLASPWPRLEWPGIPVSEVSFGALSVAVRRPQGPLMETRGSLRLLQADGRLQAEYRPDTGLLRITAGSVQAPENELEVHAQWLPQNGPAADVRLFIGRQPAQQPAKLLAQAPLSTLAELGQAFGLSLPLTARHGTLALKAEAVLGKMAGTLSTLEGEAEIADGGLQATDTTRLTGNSLELALAGKLRFAWQASGAKLGLRLQPGLNWQLTSSAGPLQATGKLEREFAILLDTDVTVSESEFPFTVRSPQWGQWEGALQRVSLTGETGRWRAADAQLRITGQLKQWQREAMQLRNVQATGDVAMHWSQAAGVRSELALQIGAERVAWAGESPVSVNKTSWKLSAEAIAKADGNFWRSLELSGEVSSPPLNVENALGHALTLGPSRLHVQRFHPARSEGELLLAVDAVKIGTWPAPDIRARLRLGGDALRADGSLLLQGTEALSFSGSHALSRSCGNATFTAQPDLPTLGKLLQPRPAALLPLDFQTGTGDARFTLDWCANPTPNFDAKGTLQLRDATLGWEQAQIEGLQASLQLDGLHPARGHIQLAARRGELATGTPIADLNIDLALSAKNLTVHALHAGMLGGAIHSDPLSLSWPPAEQSLPLEIRQIDLGQLLALFKLDGLSGSGQLDGVLPLAYRDGSVEINDGQLNSLGSGTLKYAPGLTIPDNLGLLALRNFHFRQLGLHAWYATDGAYRTQATLEGSNPELYNGYPIRFRLNINGKLPGLFRSALFSGDFNRHILEQLQSGKLD